MSGLAPRGADTYTGRVANLTKYTDDEIADHLAALRANRGNLLKTSRQRRVPMGTLRGWAGRLGNSSTASPRQVNEPKQTEARQRLAGKFRTRAEELIDSVDAEKIAKAGVRDILVAAGIATEKAELLTGGPTSRNEQVKVSLTKGPSLRERARKHLAVLDGGKAAS